MDKDREQRVKEIAEGILKRYKTFNDEDQLEIDKRYRNQIRSCSLILMSYEETYGLN